MASASHIRQTKAILELSVESTEFQKAMTSIQKRFDALTVSAGKVGLVFSGMGAAILTPLAAMTKSFASSGDVIEKMSARTGASAEELSALSFAADRSGASVESLDKATKTLMENIVDASRGGKDAAEAFKRLGLEARDLVGLPLSKQIALIAGGMGRLASEEEKAAVATKILGKNGYTLLPLLKSGEREINNLTKRAKELGVVMSQDQATAAARLSDAMTDVQYAVKGLSISIGTALEPIATAFADAASAAISFVSGVVKANPEIVHMAAALGGLLSVVGSLALGLAGLGKAISWTAGGMKSLGTVVQQLSSLAGISGGLKLTAAGVGVIALKVAALGAVAYGTYKIIERLFNYINDVKPDDLLRLPQADAGRVEEIGREARGKLNEGKTREEIETELADKTQKLRVKIELDRKDLDDEIAAAEKNLVSLKAGGRAGNKLTPLALSLLGVNFDSSIKSATEQLNTLKKKKDEVTADKKNLAAFEATVMQISKGDFWGPTVEQTEKFNRTLDETKKALVEIDKAHAKKNQSTIYDDMIKNTPDVAVNIIGGEADFALSKIEALRLQIADTEEKQKEATREENDLLQERLETLTKELDIASKQSDYMEDFRKKAEAARDAMKKRAGDIAESISALGGDKLAQEQEKAFRDLLDSGNWREANDQVLSEMLDLEGKWAEGMAKVATLLEEASKGNMEALTGLDGLYSELQRLSSRRTELEGRERDTSAARGGAERARLNVLREMDPTRFAREIEDSAREFRRQVEEAFREARELELGGGNADAAYTKANSLIEKLNDLKSFGMSRDDMAGALLGGTYSADAARRMDQGGGALEVARQQLDVQQKMEKELRDLNRKADNAGGLGV